MPPPFRRSAGRSSRPASHPTSDGAAPALRANKAAAPGPAWTATQWQEGVAGVAADMQLSLDASQIERLAAYLALLAHWNATFNLTAVRDPREMLSHHLADCLAVCAPLSRQLGLPWGAAAGGGSPAGQPLKRLVDVGSGGGLPGVVLAIVFPDLLVLCVDTVGKKAAFIRQVAAELRLSNLRAEHARVEQLALQADVVSCRAFAALADFTAWTRQLLGTNGVWMAMKGHDPVEERATLPPDVDVFHVEPLVVPGLEAARCIVWMRPAA